jgi:hypothetical protein
VRDSGLTHALLGLASLNDLMGHPVVGQSWESFVIETLLGVGLSERKQASIAPPQAQKSTWFWHCRAATSGRSR